MWVIADKGSRLHRWRKGNQGVELHRWPMGSAVGCIPSSGIGFCVADCHERLLKLLRNRLEHPGYQ